MLLSCPNCQTAYDVPDTALTGRPRTLRCANCLTTWKAAALEPILAAEATAPAASFEPVAETTESEIVAPEPPAPAAADEAREAPPSEIRRTPEPDWLNMLKSSRELPPRVEPRPAPKRGLAISVLIVVVAIVVILTAHRQIGNFWPPSLRLFYALGLR